MHLKQLKALCLVICGLAAFMAVSAAASQANWLLLRNKTSVISVEANGTTEAGRLLVPSLGLTILCGGGEGTARATDSGSVLLGSATFRFWICDVAEFEEVCSVSSPGKIPGIIAGSGSGTASMTGSEVFFTIASTAKSPLTNIIIEGEECPFVEINGETTGSVTVRVEKPLEDAALHKVVITAQSLSFGGNPAKIENNAGGSLNGSVTDVFGQTDAIHLRELSGCPTIC